jgi:hypothetical protein
MLSTMNLQLRPMEGMQKCHGTGVTVHGTCMHLLVHSHGTIVELYGIMQLSPMGGMVKWHGTVEAAHGTCTYEPTHSHGTLAQAHGIQRMLDT